MGGSAVGRRSAGGRQAVGRRSAGGRRLKFFLLVLNLVLAITPEYAYNIGTELRKGRKAEKGKVQHENYQHENYQHE